MNFPGTQQLLVGVKREAARRNVPAPTRAQVAEAVRTSAERQVFKAPKSGQAAVWALSKNSYWQVDLASFEHLGQVKLNTDHLHCIVATDVYSRYIRVQPIQEKKAEDTAAGFRLILQRAGAANKPRVCGFDDGGEWKGAFADLRALLGKTQRGITRRTGRNPTYGARVYTVEGFEGRNVRATSGEVFPLSNVLEVPVGTNAVSLQAQQTALRLRQQQTGGFRQQG